MRYAGLAIRGLLGVLARTWRLEVVGEDHLLKLRENGTGFVYVLWHNSMIPLIWRHRGRQTTMLVSAHRDGEILAQVASGMGYELIRGSSTRGGSGALRSMVRALQGGAELAVTPDGPTGPAQIAKPGATRAAATVGVPVLPVVAESPSVWRFGSWDRLFLPKPFARVRIVYGVPFVPSRSGNGGKTVQVALDRLTELARCA